VGVRFAYNYRDTFLSGTAPIEYTKGYGELDAQASYKITGNVLVTLGAANLTNAVQQKYDRFATSSIRSPSSDGAIPPVYV